MNKPELLLLTDYYSLTRENDKLRVSDIRCNDFRFIEEESLSTIALLSSEEFDDYALELFDV